MINYPLVSIVMPAYNAEKYIKNSIESILNQTYKNWELIIINDNSNDKTLDIAKKYSNIEKIFIIDNKKNEGPAASRNKAINIAKGDFISFLDSDDIWLPKKLEKQINFMLSNNVHFSYTKYYKINAENKRYSAVNPPSKITYNDLLKSCKIGCLTAVYNAKILGKFTMPTNNKREDFCTWLNILKKVKAAYLVDDFLAEYRTYESQSSSRKISMAQQNWKVYREIEKLSLMKSIYFFIFYATNGIYQKIKDYTNNDYK